jgi:hypothetical protein
MNRKSRLLTGFAQVTCLLVIGVAVAAPGPARVAKNVAKPGGLPQSVIPEKVLNQTSLTFPSQTWVDFPNSIFFEVKAVTNPLTLGTSQWQILGLLDGVDTWPTVPAMPHAPPAVFFTTTSNTIVTQPVVDQGSTWKVGVWQAKVFYDANSANPTNPNLSIQKAVCLNDTVVYPGLTYVIWPNPTAQNPLTWPTDQWAERIRRMGSVKKKGNDLGARSVLAKEIRELSKLTWVHDKTLSGHTFEARVLPDGRVLHVALLMGPLTGTLFPSRAS